MLCNFSQNSLFSSRKFLAFYDFFGNLFSEKNLPMVSSWRSMIHSFFHNDHSYLSPILARGGHFSFANFFNLLSCLSRCLLRVLLTSRSSYSAPFCKFFFFLTKQKPFLRYFKLQWLSSIFFLSLKKIIPKKCYMYAGTLFKKFFSSMSKKS